LTQLAIVSIWSSAPKKGVAHKAVTESKLVTLQSTCVRKCLTGHVTTMYECAPCTVHQLRSSLVPIPHDTTVTLQCIGNTYYCNFLLSQLLYTAATAAVQTTDRNNLAEWHKVLSLMNALLTRQERDISAALNVCVWQCRSSKVGQVYCRYMQGSRSADVFPQTVDAACDAKQRTSALHTLLLQGWTGRSNVSASSVCAVAACATPLILQTRITFGDMYNYLVVM